MVESQDIASIRAQIAQLDAARRPGASGDSACAEARQVLERRLVDAVMQSPADAAAAASAASPSRRWLFMAAAVIAGAALGLAWRASAPIAETTPAATLAAAVVPFASPTGTSHSVAPAQIDTLVDKLSARLGDHPEDVAGWMMLGRTLAVLGRHEEAVPAFKRAVALRGDDAMLLADYADALAAVGGRQLEGEPARLVARALALDPANVKALSLAGTAAFDRHDYDGALRHWDKLAQLAPDSEIARRARPGVEEARRQRGMPASKASPAAR